LKPEQGVKEVLWVGLVSGSAMVERMVVVWLVIALFLAKVSIRQKEFKCWIKGKLNKHNNNHLMTLFNNKIIDMREDSAPLAEFV
jgi:hypothetical protein